MQDSWLVYNLKGQSFIPNESPTAAAGGEVGNPTGEATTTEPKIISVAIAGCQPASGYRLMNRFAAGALGLQGLNGRAYWK